MAHTVPDLPYAFDALEPHIDARTMEIHHDKHHAAYVTNLNKALESAPELADVPVDVLISDLSKVPESIRTAVRNNGGGHSNHSLFWITIGPDAGGEPVGDLAAAIDRDLGGFAAFQEEFAKAATTRFGSGWAWLCSDSTGKLTISSSPNQDSPIMDGGFPLLGLDVWEHAYYLNYQNRRPDYIKAFWNVVNWTAVAERYAAAQA